MTPAEDGLMQAISHHLPAAGPGPEQDVRLAIAALTGCGWDPAKVTEFTALLAAPPGSTSWGAACQSCGGTADLDAVHRPAEYGIAARTEWYCHDHAACWRNRHGHTVATSLGVTA